MEEYLISKEGRLLQIKRHYEKTGRQRWNPLFKVYDDEFRESSRSFHDEEYHGDIRFYDLVVSGPFPKLITFVARFTDGTLARIWEEG